MTANFLMIFFLLIVHLSTCSPWVATLPRYTKNTLSDYLMFKL